MSAHKTEGFTTGGSLLSEIVASVLKRGYNTMDFGFNMDIWECALKELKAMKGQWIIDGEWSQYHNTMAAMKGWSLTQCQGMWAITSCDAKMFPTDEDAKQHVLRAEEDEKHEEHTLAKLATNALVIGSIRGD